MLQSLSTSLALGLQRFTWLLYVNVCAPCAYQVAELRCVRQSSASPPYQTCRLHERVQGNFTHVVCLILLVWISLKKLFCLVNSCGSISGYKMPFSKGGSQHD